MMQRFHLFFLLTIPVSSDLLFKTNNHCTETVINTIQTLAGYFPEDSLVQVVLPPDESACLPPSIIEKWFTRWQLVIIQPDTITGIKDVLTSPPDAYIVFFTDFQTSYQYQLYFFMEVQMGLMSAFWNPGAKFLFISTIHGSIIEQMENHMVIDTFNFLWKRNVFKIALIVSKSNGKIVTTFSSTPFSKRFGTCKEISKLQQLQALNSKQVSKRAIAGYRFKTPDTYLGCPLVAYTFHLPPYAIASKDDATGNQTVYSGTEIELVNLFSKLHNFSLNIFTANNEVYNGWYYKFPNGSALGMLPDVITYKIDLAFAGAIPFSKGPQNYTYYMSGQIFTFNINSMSWFVPSPSVVPHWKLGTIIFDPLLWFDLALFSFIFYIIYFVMRKLIVKDPSKRKGSVLLMLYQSGLGNPVTSPPTSGHLRIMFIVWYLFSMHIALMYNTRLFSFLTDTPLDSKIKTTEELYKSGLKTCTTNIYRDIYINSTTSYLKNLLEQSTTCNNMQDAVNKFFKTRDFSIMGKEDTIQFLAKSHETELNKLHQSFITYPVAMFTTKGSPLKNLLDRLISRITESGITNKWENALKYDFKIKNTDKKDQAFTNNVLNVEDFLWIFLTLISGLVLALNILFIELYYHRCYQ